MKNVLNWLKAFWLSFLVSQNVHRLAFLRQQLIADQSDDHQAFLATYHPVINSYLARHLDSEIFTLDEAQKLLDEIRMLVGVMEVEIYGTD